MVPGIPLELLELVSLPPRAPGGFGVLFGAGASVRSGIPMVKPFLSYVLDTMGSDPEHREMLLSSGLPFEWTMKKLGQLFPLDALLNIYELGTPCATHFFLAQAMRERSCTYAVTTNFDQHLERAYRDLERSPLKVGIHGIYDLSSTDEQNNAPPTPKLSKVHGCISDRTTVALTIESVFGKVQSSELLADLRALLVTGPWPTVLVLGYSCSDVFDVTPAIFALADASNKRVLLLEHASDASLWRTRPLRELSVSHPFRTYRGEVITCDVNRLVTSFFGMRSIAEPGVTPHAVPWRGHVDRWIASARTDKQQSGLELALGHLLQDIAQHKAADIYYERAATQCRDTPAHKGPIYGSLARSAMLQGDLKRAKAMSLRSIEYGEQAADIRSVAIRRVHHAQILNREGDHAGAEDQLRRAIATYKALGEDVLLQVALANLGATLVAREAWWDAEQPLRQAIAFAKANNQLDLEAQRLQVLSEALRGQGRRDEAESCLERAVSIAVKMGNPGFLAITRASLASLQLDQGKVEDALRTAEAAVKSFTDLGDPLNLARATNVRGRAKSELGQLVQAEIDHCAAIKLLRTSGHIAGLSSAYQALALTLSRMGRHEEAKRAEHQSQRFAARGVRAGL